MLIDHWPLLGLRLITPRLELRPPTGEELSDLADLAAEGMHDPDSRPFLVSWPGRPAKDRARALVQRHWLHRGDWSADDWSLDLAVFADGQVVGQQDISARDYPVLREVSTFSWLGVRHHGKGIGTHMRAAALHLDRWEATEQTPVTITGLTQCLPLFGPRPIARQNGLPEIQLTVTASALGAQHGCP